MARKKPRLGSNPLDWIKPTAENKQQEQDVHPRAAIKSGPAAETPEPVPPLPPQQVAQGADTLPSRLTPSPSPTQRRINILSKIKEGQLTPEQGLRLIKQEQKQAALMYFQPTWKEAPAKALDGSDFTLEPGRPLLLFDINDRAYNLLRERLPEDRLILVKPGSGFRELGSHTYEIDPQHLQDYRRFIEHLGERRLFPGHILHLWSREEFSFEPGTLDRQLHRGLYSLFFLSQALMEQASAGVVRLLAVYLDAGANPQPQYAALSGFTRSLHMENPRFICSTASMDAPGGQLTAAQMDVLLQELAETDPEVCFLGGTGSKRLVRCLEEWFPPTPAAAGALPLKDRGVYLVTGGAGGLGKIFAEYLAHKVKEAQLVLTGRSDLQEGTKQQVKLLQDAGARVVYVKADIAAPDDVERLRERIMAHFAGLDGIIHSAGVNRDNFLLKKTAKDIEAVLAAKVSGTLNLDRVFGRDNLDFFVMFSSLAGVNGNAGQCDYAFANAFLDHFAALREKLRKQGRRRGKTLSIDWPLWESGGMQVEDKERALLSERTGLELLPVKRGIEAWETALGSGLSQCIAAYGKPGLKFFLTRGITYPAAVPGEGEARAACDTDLLSRQTGKYLQELFSELLKLPVEKIAPDTPFQEYGVDSLMIHQFNARMEQELGKLARTLLFEYQTLQELTEYMVANHRGAWINLLGLDEGKGPVKDRRAFGPITVAERRPPDDGEGIAVIGVSGRYPQAADLGQFWDNLAAGRDCISKIPASRWDYRLYYDPDPEKGQEGKIYCPWGGFLDDIGLFDPLFFNISPREAETIDPQERLFLETAWGVLEDAGYTRQQLSTHEGQGGRWADVAVFAGVTNHAYHLLGLKSNYYKLPVPSSLANRVSYVLNLHGPSMPVDTACSSSLTAIHLACESLKKGECRLAIAGGVNLCLHPNKYILMSQLRMLSAKGRCFTFGSKSDGFVPGEGVGAVLLKPLKAAVADRDHIYAVIKSTAVNHGGTTHGYTVPNPNAQARLILSALRSGGIDARTISYLEAHGTGTILGDPVEITGLTKAFREYTGDKQYCAIGSVKSNIGHLESAAGIAGFTKVLLQMKHRRLVPSLHCHPLNPNIDFADSPFFVQRELSWWQGNCPRRAGISSFGAGGANAHVILEEYEDHDHTPATDNREPHLVVLSARNSDRLQAYAERIKTFLDKQLNGNSKGQDGKYHMLRQRLLKDLTVMAAQILHTNPGFIAANEDIADYGFDAVTLAEFAARINDRWEIGLTSTLFPKPTTLVSLAAVLSDREDSRHKLLAYYRDTEASREEQENTPYPAVCLPDIAYTLQVGREAMDERIALVVSDADELREKLELYTQGQRDIEGLFQGSPKTGKENAGLIIGKAKERFLRLLVEDRDLAQLGRLWAAGMDIDWRLLYASREHAVKPRRVSLPGYPFNGKHSWLPAAGVLVPPLNTAAPSLHPLLAENTSTLSQQRFSSRFTGREFFLADHVAAGKKTLPGVAYIEMACAAGEISAEKRVAKIERIIWAQPIVLEDNDAGKEVHIALYLGEGREAVVFQVSTGEDSSDNRVVHAHGRLLFEEETAARDAVEGLDIEAALKTCSRSKEGAACYRLFAEGGLSYGPSFQAIETLYFAEDGSAALAKLQLPDVCKQGFDRKDFLLHPSLLDGALQTVMGLMVSSAGQDAPLYLPFALAGVEILQSLKETCYAYAVPASADSDQAVKKYYILLTDESGQVLLRMTDFSVRAMPARKLQQETAKSETVYFQSMWQETAIVSGQAADGVSSPILLFAGGDKPGQDLIGHGADVILVTPGDEYRKLKKESDRLHSYQIAVDREEDYGRLFDDLGRQDLHPRQIIHDWSPEYCPDEQQALKQQLDRGIYSFYFLVRTLLARGIQKAALLYLYPISLQDRDVPSYGAVSGFARTVSMESPGLLVKTLGVCGKIQPGDLLMELESRTGGDSEVRYRDGKRFVKTFNEFIPRPAQHIPLRDKGVYIITGGLGALGLLFARFLAEQSKARLVLVDLVDIDADSDRDARISALKSLGAEVLVVQADVSQQADVEKVVGQARARFKEINGIMHTAGLIRDAYLVNKTKEQLETVIAPKVLATVWLDEASRDDSLDFFVLFSSMTAVFGNPGQSDYAYANGFMDRFAEVREQKRTRGERRGKTLSINWPLWKEGGMKVDSQTRDWVEKRSGLVPLETTVGLAAFQAALCLDKVQAGIATGNRSKILRQLGILPTDDFADPGTYPAALAAQTAGNDHAESVPADASLQERVEDDLVRLCSEILKVSDRELDRDEELGHYGLDSIMMMTMLNRLETMYGEVVNPNALAEFNTVKKLAAHLIDRGVVKVEGALHRDTQTPAVPRSSGEGIQEPVTKRRFLTSSPHFTGYAPMQAAANATGREIAVIGMACRFPGSVDVEAFRQNLETGRHLVTEVPADRFRIADFYSPDKQASDKTYSKWGGFIDDIYAFDAAYFGISDVDALVMDPHHRILLELTEELCCRAGYRKEDIGGTRTGVYIGGGESGYGKYHMDIIPPGYMKHYVVNNSQNMIAARLSDYYDLKGPAHIVDTACSSALVAIHQACRSIGYGECEMAIAGGIDLILDARVHIGFSKAEVLSDDGVCYVFDERAKGFVLGEGAGVVLLKSYEAALDEGDNILAVIKGSAVNNDGHTMGLTVPSLEGQKEIIRMALKNSGVSPGTVTLLEAHGTGTLLGDPIEIKAATQVYRETTQRKHYCAVGSVKSNMGHLLRAAGMPSFIKVVLSLQGGQLFPTLHCNRPHPRFKFAESPFYPITHLKRWQPPGGLRRAGVSSFGFGGTNCHMILEEFTAPASYRCSREPLALPRFKRKNYRIGEEITPVREQETSLDDGFLIGLLEDIQEGNLSPSEGARLI